jgi:outer membrane receptor for ferrienterochelin and colicin
VPSIPSYTATDLNWIWQVSSNATFNLGARNLGNKAHLEFNEEVGGLPSTPATEVHRSIYMEVELKI